jgi:hypothetical protein
MNGLYILSSFKKATHGRSRRSLFRDLASLGYLTSFTHAGRYYTLADIPQFDERGLWFYKTALSSNPAE